MPALASAGIDAHPRARWRTAGVTALIVAGLLTAAQPWQPTATRKSGVAPMMKKSATL
jgi:hypothetical protein